jgi:hypothetical protein
MKKSLDLRFRDTKSSVDSEFEVNLFIRLKT